MDKNFRNKERAKNDENIDVDTDENGEIDDGNVDEGVEDGGNGGGDGDDGGNGDADGDDGGNGDGEKISNGFLSNGSNGFFHFIQNFPIFVT